MSPAPASLVRLTNCVLLNVCSVYRLDVFDILLDWLQRFCIRKFTLTKFEGNRQEVREVDCSVLVDVSVRTFCCLAEFVRDSEEVSEVDDLIIV